MKVSKNRGILFAAIACAIFAAGCNSNDNASTKTKLANPSAQYCTNLGYKYDTATGKCIFGNNISCNAWDFYRGKCAQSYSYCEKHGGTISNRVDTSKSTTYEYAVCVFKDGTECLEQDYMDGKCNMGQCDKWKLSEGGCIK